MHITILASNDIFSPSNKIQREVRSDYGIISTPMFNYSKHRGTPIPVALRSKVLVGYLSLVSVVWCQVKVSATG